MAKVTVKGRQAISSGLAENTAQNRHDATEMQGIEIEIENDWHCRSS